MKGSNSRKNDYKLSTFDELDKELQAADKFLNKNNNEILKESNFYNPYADNSDKNSQNGNNLINSNSTKEDDPMILKYQKRLKSFGFPLIGSFKTTNDEDKEKMFQFFEFVIGKKTMQNEENMKYKKQIDLLSTKLNSAITENEKLQKEVLSLVEENKKFSKDKKDFESKLTKSKENLEKQLNEFKSNFNKLNNRFNVLMIEKKSIEEKYTKISEVYQKLTNNKIMNLKPNNNIEVIDNLKKNDFLKQLSKIKGTEKLIQTFKDGYNESLRELLFEISALKNFIFELNTDVVSLVKNSKYNLQNYQIEYSLLNMPFLDTVNRIKSIFKLNLNNISKCLSLESFDIDEIDNFPIGHQSCLKISEINKSNDHHQNNNLTNLKNFDPIFTIETPKEEKQNETFASPCDDYETELEFLKKKWVKTLMRKDSQNSNENNSFEDEK